MKQPRREATAGAGSIAESCPALATPWTEARRAPLSVGFSRLQYCGGLPFPSPGDLPDPGIEHGSPARQADSSPPELRLLSIHVIYLSNLPPKPVLAGGGVGGCQGSTAAKSMETAKYETRDTAITTCHGAEDSTRARQGPRLQRCSETLPFVTSLKRENLQ